MIADRMMLEMGSIEVPDRTLSLRDRTLELLRTEIQFVPNPAFCEFERNSSYLDSDRQDEVSGGSSGKVPKGLPAHLTWLCEQSLLTAKQEAKLFREMNFLKFRANALRSRLDPDDLDEDLVEEISETLDRANSVRDQIIRSNIRLVISVIKRFVSGRDSFDDLLSDGIWSLMAAVEKFDYSRGFRFSTYAFQVITRNAGRQLKNINREKKRYASDGSEHLGQSLEETRQSLASEQSQQRVFSKLEPLLDLLDPRERMVIRGRFALGHHREVKTCQRLAEKLGVSKERVRQLEQRAISKLRKLANQLNLEDELEIGTP